MNRNFELLVLIVLFAAAVTDPSVLSAQQQPTTGIPPLSSTAGGPFDMVDLGNLNVHFAIPIFSRPGKGGMNFSYRLAYDSLVWVSKNLDGNQTWQPVSRNWGWTIQTDATSGRIAPSNVTSRCSGSNATVYTYSPLTYIDPSGTSHRFPGPLSYSSDPSCNHSQLTQRATDGSGLLLNATAGVNQLTAATITTLSGIVLAPLANSVTDPNGNQFTMATSNSITTFTDTLDTNGSHVLSIDQSNPNAVKYTYPTPAGTAHVTVNYSSYKIQTLFNVNNIDVIIPLVSASSAQSYSRTALNIVSHMRRLPEAFRGPSLGESLR